jgi:MFS family permease
MRCLYQPDDTFATPSPRTCIPMDAPTFAIVTSIFTLGGLIGALSSGPLSTAYGRLLPLRLASIFFVLGPVLSALAPNIGFLVTGRFLSGVGSGAALVIVPIYIGEIAPMASKGSFGALTQITINVGILLAQVLGYFLSYDAMWRVVLAVAGLLAVVQAAGLLGVVESPKWLASKEKVALARGTLQRIRGDTDIEPEVAHWGNGGEDEGMMLDSSTLNLHGRRYVLLWRRN